jgi:hypothetical protein
MYFIQHCFVCRPSDSTVSEDAGIEPRTDCCDFGIGKPDALTTRLDHVDLYKSCLSVFEAALLPRKLSCQIVKFHL